MIEPPVRLGQNRFPRSAVLALSLTLLTLGGLSWMAFRDYRYVTTQIPLNNHLEELRAQVLLFDEVLTMSARMSAATGDPQWEARYRLFEPQLDRIIREIRRDTPVLVSRQAVAQTDIANNRLVVMEHRAFELVRQGQQAEARQLLSSKEYESEKKAYAGGMAEFDRLLKQMIDSIHSERQRQVFWNVVTAAVAAPSLIVLWWLVLGTAHRWRTALVENNRQLKQTEEALKHKEQRLSLALDSGEMGAWELDLVHDTAIRTLKHDQIFGYQSLQAQWGAQIFMSHVCPEDREVVRKRFDEAAATDHLQIECRIIWKDRSLHWIAAHGLVYRDQKGAPLGMRGVVMDITKRKQAEERIARLNSDLQARAVELAEANKELESFSYSVSHDLRAPLRSIDGFSQILLEDYADHLADEGKDALRRVRKAATTMGELIDAILALSRVSRSELRAAPVDVSAMAATIAAELRESQPDRHAEFVIAPGLVVDGDQILLRAALENLLGNAWKYTQPRVVARIEFGCIDRENETVYFVRDNGVGFDMTYVGKLFGTFQRLHRQTEFDGIGIGLATVQRIVHRHRGRAWAEGAVDQGATFYFTLHGSARSDLAAWENTEALASVS